MFVLRNFIYHLQGEESIFKCQPYIWDCPGLPDDDDKNITRILRLIINGRTIIIYSFLN